MDLSTLPFKIVVTFIAVLGFALFFNVRKERILYATIGGVITWLVFFFLHNKMSGIFAPTLVASMFAGIYAEVLARLFKTPATVFFITAVIPLVPGRSLYYTMLYAVSANWEQCGSYAFTTFEGAAGIAIGICAITAVVQTWMACKRRAKVIHDRRARKSS
jgi:uncharacterized membrane protein YjjB (DUF3815 family)